MQHRQESDNLQKGISINLLSTKDERNYVKMNFYLSVLYVQFSELL